MVERIRALQIEPFVADGALEAMKVCVDRIRRIEVKVYEYDNWID